MEENLNYLPEGTLLYHGHYRIERVLGQGGFGITYLAMDMTLGRKVAIKEFFPKDFCNRDNVSFSVSAATSGGKELIGRLRQKFIKEAQNLAKLNHPNIIKIQTIFEENETAYYVMDYIDGFTLAELVKFGGPMPETLSVRYIQQIGDALEYIHSKHINHLDVKPANIIVRTSDNFPILIDFGLSKQYDSEGMQTSTTPTGISHGYAPPEQYADGGVKEFSPKTDLYSLAATFYYLLTASVPPKSIELLNESLNFPLSFPQKYRETVLRAMSPIKSGRQETIKDFLEELSPKEKRPPIPKIKPPSIPVIPVEPEISHEHPQNNDRHESTLFENEPRPIFSEEKSVDEFDDEEDTRKRNFANRIFNVLLILLLLGAAGFGAYKLYQSLNGKVKPVAKVEDPQTALVPEEWRDFTTPDLASFDVHGPVKSIKFTSMAIWPQVVLKDGASIEFDKNEQWSNYRLCQKEDPQTVQAVKSNRYIHKLNLTFSEGNTGSYEFNHNNKGQLIEFIKIGTSPYGTEEFKCYDFEYKNGNLDKCQVTIKNDNFIKSYGTFKFSIIKNDYNGNWLKMKVTPVETFKFNENTERFEPAYEEPFTISREITYYDY